MTITNEWTNKLVYKRLAQVIHGRSWKGMVRELGFDESVFGWGVM
jgi:hypothetical protein